ncbi:MAG: hypothetical protein ACXAEF_06515 [Candidatus Thorarchaeota archaeon]|jgi:hypothetical protein
MDLKIVSSIGLLLVVWVVAVVGYVGVNLAIGVSAWMWMGIAVWYSLRSNETIQSDSIPTMFEGEIV